MSRFEINSTPLEGLQVLQRKIVSDARGYLERMFCSLDLRELMSNRLIVQINRTLTKKKGAVRGMHFQKWPQAEGKIISCLRGEIFDVAVDLRSDSPTFLKWHGEHLSAENSKSMFIPEGYAHGFQALTEDCELFYMHTAAYSPAHEGGLSPLDPVLAIRWPLPIADLSERDATHPMLAANCTKIF